MLPTLSRPSLYYWLLRLALTVGWLTGVLPQPIAIAQEGAPTAVSFPGSYASQIGGAEWEPADPAVQAADEDGDGIWTLAVELAGGVYEFKAAINGSWDENYGQNGEAGGANLTVDVHDAGGQVTFSYNRADNQVAAQVAELPGAVGDDLPPAVGDASIGMAGLLHQSRSDAYRTPFGALPFDTDVTLRLRTFADDAERVELLLSAVSNGAKKSLPLRRVASDASAAPWGYDYWEVTLNSGPTPEIHSYLFQITDGDEVLYYADENRRDGGSGQVFTVQPTSEQGWDIYTYDPAFTTPDWAKNALIYQIFPDRFRNGDPANDPTADDWFYENERGHAFPVTPWNRPVPDPQPNDPAANPDWFGTYSSTFYGGDLQGVAEKLDYLQALGVTTIYFNPIFDSPSNHRYDGRDYRQIAENLAVRGDGAASNALFAAFAAAVEARGMHLILDGVPNHVSSDAPIFDRFQRHPEVGGCESVDSPWRDYFFFRPARPAGTGACDGDTNYNAWAGFDTLPQLDTASQAVIDNWLAADSGIATSYLQMPGIDGWRVDVVPDVVGINPDFFSLWRQATRAANPDAISYSETWQENDARQRLLGDEFDSTMNYRFRQAVLGFLRDTDFQDNDGTIPALTATEFEDALRAVQEDYPYPAWSTAMNLISSHDVNRAVDVLDHAGIDRAAGQPVDGFADARARLRLAAALQMTLPGAPTIYYGDESGLAGFGSDPQRDDPYNRQPYPWPDAAGYDELPAWAQQQDDLIDLYSFLGQLRGQHSYLRTGSWDTFLTDDAGLYVFGRKDASGAALIAVNRSPISQTVGLELAGYLPRSAALIDAASGQTATVSLRQVVQPMDFRIWHTAAEIDLTAPAAPSIDAVEEGSAVVTLTIAIPPLTSRVVVRRSLVDGGFQPVGVIDASDRGKTVIFVDEGLANGQPVYYRAVAFNDVGLASEPGPSMQAIPHARIDDARLLQPTTIEHVISTRNPSGFLQAVVTVAGVTDAEGAGAGILARAGFVLAAPDALPGAQEIRWVDAEYAGDAGAGDLYAAALLPDALGDYLYGFIFSTTGGRDWVYADTAGMGVGMGEGIPWAAPGTLTVLPSDDTEAPSRPFRLQELSASPDQLTIGWWASPADDFSHYLLCRRDVSAGEQGCAKRIVVSSLTQEYADADVLADHTYAYTAQQVDTSFNASAPSAELTISAAGSFVKVTWRVLAPDFTPAGDELFIAGDNADVFGAAFSPGSQPLTKTGDNLWEWSATVKTGTVLQYKYTRGSWETVEQWGTISGLTNRLLEVTGGSNGTLLVDDTATDWDAEGPDDRRAVQVWRDPLVTGVEVTAKSVTVHFASPVAVSGEMADVVMVTDTNGESVAGKVTQSGDDSFVFTPTRALTPGTYTVTVFAVTTDVPMFQPWQEIVEIQ